MSFQISSFWRNVVTLMSGTVLSQLLLVACTPILSRMYLPAAFGIMGAYLGALLVLTVVSNAGFEMAIMLPASDREAHQLCLLSMLIGLLLSCIVLVASFWFAEDFLRWIGLPELIGWHLFLPLSLLLESVYQACYQALNRFQKYKSLASSRLIKTILQLGLSLGLGLLGYGFEGLLIGLLGGQLAAGIFLAFAYFIHAQSRQLGKDTQVRELLRVGSHYLDFPIFGMASSALNTAGKQLPYFFLPRLFAEQGLGKAMSGNFQQTQKLLSLPIGVFAVSLGAVFYERAGRAKDAGGDELATLTKKTTQTLFVLGFLPSLVVMILGPDLFQLFLGKNWLIAGQYAQVLMPWFYLSFVAVPLSYLVDVKRKLHVYLGFNVALFVCQFLALLIGSIYLADIQLMACYGGLSALLVAIQIAYFYRLGVKA